MDRFRQQEWSIALRELEMQREHIRRLMDHPLQNVMNEIDTATRLHQTLRASSVLTAVEMASLQVRPEQWSPLHDLLRAERANKLSAELDAAKQTQLQFPTDPLGTQRASELLLRQEQLKSLTSSATFNIIREIQERYNAVHALTGLPNLAAMADLTIQAMKAGYIDQPFSQTFTGSILESLSHLQRSHGYEELETNLDIFERSLEERIQAIPRGIISFDTILGIFVDILLFVISIIMSNQSENRIIQGFIETKSLIESHIDSQQEKMMNEFTEFKNKVFNKLDKIYPKQEGFKIFYIATRTVNIRSDASKKPPVIAKLHENQKVALITSKEKWIYIEYFDYINGIPKMGWVYGEYLTRLPEEGK